jgi:maltose O-acetyltransferase
MLAGELYDPNDPELAEARMIARMRCHTINTSAPRDEKLRRSILKELFGSGGNSVWLEPPFRCDYGTNIYLGEKVYFNFDCVILDVCEVRIGNHVFIAPGVHIYTATHPLEAELRRTQKFGNPAKVIRRLH